MWFNVQVLRYDREQRGMRYYLGLKKHNAQLLHYDKGQYVVKSKVQVLHYDAGQQFMEHSIFFF